MKKQTVRVSYSILIYLTIFAIGSLEISYANRLVSDSNEIYKRDLRQKKELSLHINTTEDSDMEEYILEIDCERFNVSFNFSSTIIKVLGKDFLNTSFITCLNFDGNQIESVESGAFDNLPSLEYLNMGRNYISSLFSFNGHDNIKVLVLAGQSISYYDINLEIMGEYPELRYLDLSSNKISSIRWPVSHQNSYNQFNRKSAFPKLKHLDLSNNNLYQFYNYYDNSILFNQNITHLNLSNNYLTNVDLRYFSNLIELRLDNNNIEGINKYCYNIYVCIDEMPRLKYFSISNNKINSLDQFIFKNTPELVTLNLSNNQLAHILPKVFYGLDLLENLYLDHNELSSINSLSRLSNLSVLYVSHNNIREIGSEDISNARILKKLYLDHNKIENIHKNTFSELESLEELYLESNNLAKLPVGWANNLRNLRYLNLSNNKFILLESLSLIESLPVIRIDLMNNNFIHMKPEKLRNLPENATIYLISLSEDNELSKEDL
ncbi:protein artichoke-like [Vespa mandarinia]|uniref:protein artichoke-like n=1 Tax=Vespa mandarinia TaxID=7446 RepID=UPI0016112220|nr:protein artichoke-like [Vespa mandarinia]XP_035740198.1 protein artichoke-like [Vespa mandarinia]XP_035740199.1 protein artichoke-like [Vespa mandarinia]XP_035740200.1 protein artichoke-like [Vespa mandarinia]